MGRASSERGEGVAEKVGGKIKEAAGKVFGNEQMEAEGKAKELKGEAQEESAKTQERSEGKVAETTGAVKNRVGAALGDEKMQAEGKAKELEGQVQQKTNK